MLSEANDRTRASVFVLGASSDIGKALVLRYLEAGYNVRGTYRNPEIVSDLIGHSNLHLHSCDVLNRHSVTEAVRKVAHEMEPWETFISCIGTEEPIGKFFDCDFDEWESSVTANCTAQLRVLHQLYPYRRKDRVCNVVFFAGGGTNNPFTAYSAYCVSKIMLIKMCELLDDEEVNLNVFILGPGFVRTKIHQQTLDNSAAAGTNYQRTVQFLKPDNEGTSFDDIYRCINWAIGQGREVSGGRNFSIVHDPWRAGGEDLIEELRRDRDMFKLRRFVGQKRPATVSKRSGKS